MDECDVMIEVCVLILVFGEDMRIEGDVAYVAQLQGVLILVFGEDMRIESRI